MVSRCALRCAVVIVIFTIASIAHADYVGPFTETWSDDGDLEGWYSYLGVEHDDINDRLLWSGVDSEFNEGCLYYYDDNPSGTRYLGDLTGAEAISFDFSIDAGSSVDSVWIEFVHDDNYSNKWQYDLGTPVIGETSYTLLLDSPNWTQSEGTDTLAEALTDVTEWDIYWTRDGLTGTVSGWIDNFSISGEPAATTPEPGTMALVMLGLGSLGYLRRRKSVAK